ncbi:MAG: hypothetical protein ABJB86_24095, partial [Bacteroidota bacterium]
PPIAFSGYSLYFVSPMETRLLKISYRIFDVENVKAYFDYLRVQSVYIHAAAKRIIFFMLVAQLISTATQAQTSHSHKKEDFDVHEFDQQTISISSPGDILHLNNISGIQVIDARSDISNIGLMQKRIVEPFLSVLNNSTRNQSEQRINKVPTFITLTNGLQPEAKEFATTAIKFSHDNSLPRILMVIKKLWLSDELNLDDNRHAANRFLGPASKDVWTSGIEIKVEFYLDYRGDYYAMYRYDSVITEAMTTSEYASQFVAKALRLSMERLPEMDAKITVIMEKRKFNMQEISFHNENDFNIPALRDAVLRPGVYMTFEDFKKNDPAQTHFEIRKDKLTDILYIKQPDGKESVTRDIWGYCNGKNAYIKAGDNFFLLQRKENAFYIFGAKTIKRTDYNNPGAGSYYAGSSVTVPYYYTSSRTAIQLEPFQLDWSTGKLY